MACELFEAGHVLTLGTEDFLGPNSGDFRFGFWFYLQPSDFGEPQRNAKSLSAVSP